MATNENEFNPRMEDLKDKLYEHAAEGEDLMKDVGDKAEELAETAGMLATAAETDFEPTRFSQEEDLMLEKGSVGASVMTPNGPGKIKKVYQQGDVELATEYADVELTTTGETRAYPVSRLTKQADRATIEAAIAKHEAELKSMEAEGVDEQTLAAKRAAIERLRAAAQKTAAFLANETLPDFEDDEIDHGAYNEALFRRGGGILAPNGRVLMTPPVHRRPMKVAAKQLNPEDPDFSTVWEEASRIMDEAYQAAEAAGLGEKVFPDSDNIHDSDYISMIWEPEADEFVKPYVDRLNQLGLPVAEGFVQNYGPRIVAFEWDHLQESPGEGEPPEFEDEE